MIDVTPKGDWFLSRHVGLAGGIGWEQVKPAMPPAVSIRPRYAAPAA